MSLFQNSVVTKQLQSQDKSKLLERWNVFKKHFHNPTIQENIRSSKEEQYQGEFLIDLFVNVLGYTKNPTPNFSLTTEYKNVKDSKKADGAILIPSTLSTTEHAPLVKAVIELKGTNTTDLNKIEVQAFGYKNNQPDCVYVITSNFEKLRFYIDNATEHIEFNLFKLTEKEFELLYLCLAYENIANDVPKKLKEQSVSQEKDITKKLYTDYSLFKRELHQDLVKQNPQFNALELFQKSQKLLDRFLFIFFAEDRNLLPTNLIFRINKEWRQLQEMRINISLYDRYKVYFNDLNKGAKVSLPAFSETVAAQKEEHQIFAYNGGLFQPDAILDSIKIDDELLFKHTQKLSHYDFQSEIDVNILGHIFENSLNELDEIKAQLEGTTIAKATTKRKKDGVFYTPKYITKYIVDNTIGKLCQDKKAELQIIEEDYFTDKKRTKTTKQPLLEKLTTYRNWLLQITICDPACGSGAFLNQALDFLITEHHYIDELQAKLFGDALVLSDVEKSILENNLYGVDLNEESVEIAKLSLWLRTAQPNRKLNDLNNNIKCGNSLIDDATIAGDKAFRWQTAFPQVFKEKQKKPWHITTAIHDSRTSQRMIDYKVREKRAMGTMPEPQIIPLTAEEETIIVENIIAIVTKDNLSVMAFNVCRDHIHLVLACEEEAVSKIVQKIKAITARAVNINRGFTIPMEYAPLHTTMEHAPLSTKRGVKQNSLWTQKFGCKEILDDNQLYNTIEYVKKNRIKHELPILPILQQSSMLHCLYQSYEHAFREEYKGGFDVVIGNPPYVSRSLNDEMKNFLNSNFETAQYQVELYVAFMEQGLKICKLNGSLSYIVPNSWLKNLMMSDCRKFILENLKLTSIIPNLENVFTEASVDTMIFIGFKNSIGNNDISIDEFVNKVLKIKHKVNQQRFLSNKNFLFDVEINDDILPIIDKMNSDVISIGELFDVTRGINPYDRNTGQTAEVISSRAYHSEIKKDETFVPELKGMHASRYSYTWDKKHFISYGKWLAAPRQKKYFEGQRIIFREILGKTLVSTLIDEDFMIDRSLYIAKLEENMTDKFITTYVLSILNSKLMAFFFRYSNNEFDNLFPKIRVAEFKNLPIKNISLETQQPFIEKAYLMLSLNKDLQEQSQKFQRTLTREHAPLLDAGLPKKLQDWYLLPYAEFIKELEKQKIKLSLSQKAEWEEYFNTEAKKLLEIKTQINATDKAIDAMVYELYGLSVAEIEIVENN